MPLSPLLTEVLLISSVLSIGPFLYAYFVRRNAFFHEHTIAGLTHELKTPLAAIQSAIEVLIASQADTQNSNNAAYLNMIRNNADRLQAFVGNLVQVFGDGGESKNVLALERADLSHMCRLAVDSSRWVADQKCLVLHLDLPSHPIEAMIDPAKIDQVLSNLMSNAIKFTDLGRILVTLRQTDGLSEIMISDTGSGLSAEELPRIFDRFYQGPTGRKKKGTGIGLTIAKTWVEAHGGRIWAESDGEGKGTTIRFTLPV